MKSHIVYLVIGAVLSASPFIQAQESGTADPERKAAADKLLRTLKVDESMKSAFQQVEQMQKSMIAQQAKSPEQRAQAEKASAAAMKSVAEEFSWEKMGGMFVEIYAEVFTKEELDGLNKFYESPVGKKFVEKQPQLQAATMKRMQSVMMELMPKVQEKVKAAMAETKESAPAEESASSPTPPTPAN